MLVKVKNNGNSFQTITSGQLNKGASTNIEAWEAKMWLADESKNIEIIDEPKSKKKKK